MASLNTGSVIISWKKAQAQEGISHYRVYMDNKLVGNTLDDSTKYTVNNMELYVQHSFYVVGVTNQCRVTKSSNVAYITVPTAPKPISNDLDFNLNKYL